MCLCVCVFACVCAHVPPMLIWEMTCVDRSADGKKRSPNCAITGLNRCNREFFAFFLWWPVAIFE